MKRIFAAPALAGAMMLFAIAPAAADVALQLDNSGRQLPVIASAQVPARSRAAARIPRADPRPGKWCMWWLRRELGIPRAAFRPYEWNLARAGRYIGAPATGPAPGVIVVWRHHVGIITGRRDGRWVVKSGNDGGRVRERARSLKGAIAFRRWDGGGADTFYSARRRARR